MQLRKAIRIALAVLAFAIVGGLWAIHGLGQPKSHAADAEETFSFTSTAAVPQSSCTWGSLLATSDCDQKWNKYKDGYKYCVEKSAKFFWKEYACSSEALEKLQRSCRGCEKQFQK